ncbi:MAG: Hsp33 family molecular chaperone HslO [Bacteriovoracaceae bacterium]|nr:Hsp33 family molecular chaperone HslO [Bacteriovoracaceae bacterium]
MLPESKVLSFLDEKYGFSLRFLEGQKLIHDLAIIHDVKKEGFSFFRELVLSGLHLISYLKMGEGFGLFIDSEDPYFRFKLEANEHGTMRTLLFPEDFCRFPEGINGVVRLSKISKNNPKPYTSIIELKNERAKDIANQILKESYQVQGKIVLSDKSDQSFYLTKLPRKNINKQIEDLSLDEFWNEHGDEIVNILDEGLIDSTRIKNKMSDLGFTFLHDKTVEFKCPCSREQMLLGITSLVHNHTVDEIFEEKNEIETRCDYCKTYYIIEKKEILKELKVK